MCNMALLASDERRTQGGADRWSLGCADVAVLRVYSVLAHSLDPEGKGPTSSDQASNLCTSRSGRIVQRRGAGRNQYTAHMLRSGA